MSIVITANRHRIIVVSDQTAAGRVSPIVHGHRAELVARVP